MNDRPDIVVRLTHSLAGRPSRDPFALRLCHAVVEIAAARDGSISLGLRTAQRTLLCATSEAAARFEEAQELAQQGPSVDALRSGRLVVATRHDDQVRRWPILTDAVPWLEPSEVRAVPIQPQSSLIGVLTVHHDLGHRPVLGEDELQFLADTVGTAILHDLPDDLAVDELGSGLLWSDRDRISQATGMVVAQLDLEPDDAIALVRAHAFAQDLSVVEVSRLIIERDLHLADPGDDAP